jgi:MFS-type transporter involved in bile tolerance (Atg22 family)
MDFPVLYFFISLFIAVVFALFCGELADRKGYSRVLFSILGFFFIIITLIVILVLPSKQTS